MSGRSRRMGSKVTFERRQRSLLMVAWSLAMLLVTVPAVAGQAPGGITSDPGPRDQYEPGQPDKAPVEPPVGVPRVCEHAAGEFLVGYVSEEALQAAPPENVVETFDGILAQHLSFEEIKNIPDPAGQRAAEEAKKQELEDRPGVAYVEYNCLAQAAAEEQAAASPTPAMCSDCSMSVVKGARKIIADGLEGARGRDAYNAALEAARSADPANAAFASETETDKEATPDETDSDVDSEADSEADSGVDDGTGNFTAEPGEDGSETGEKAADGASQAEEDAASDEAEVDPEEDTGTGSEAEPVVGRNTAASPVRRGATGFSL
jgi:hypothetical protein